MHKLLSQVRIAQADDSIPELHNGDHLTQPEFHRRYCAMPEGVRAELINGVVYMASPLGYLHGDPHFRLAGLFAVYEASTPGVRGSDNSTVILRVRTELQPDLHLRLLPECGGRVVPGDKGFLIGPPELVVEVANSSEAIDLHEKRDAYRRAGVLEYLVLSVREGQLHAFDLKAGRDLKADADGVYRSKVFPGLWIESAAALQGETARMLQVVQRGLADPAHVAFVNKLAKRKAKSSPAASKGGKSRTTRRSKK